MSKVFIQESTLTAIGDAIRTQTGGTDLIAPGDMPAEILAIEVGSAGYVPTEEDLKLTGECGNKFSNNGWAWVIDNYGDKITSENITSMTYMFSESSKLEEVPFELNANASSTCMTDNMFVNCTNLRVAPKMNNVKAYRTSRMFYNCNNLRELAGMENWDFSYINTMSYQSASEMFVNCYSLRSVPEDWLKGIYNIYTSYYGAQSYMMFCGCYCLDEIKGMPFSRMNSISSNLYKDTFKNCARLKELTFETGITQTSWTYQDIDLTTVGYLAQGAGYESYITGYNSGITADKEVYDDATYQALKDDPDWWTKDIAYSRYNGQSLYNTIMSLPTLKQSASNYITVLSEMGSKTDGGSIADAISEYGPYAANKGWTVAIPA